MVIGGRFVTRPGRNPSLLRVLAFGEPRLPNIFSINVGIDRELSFYIPVIDARLNASSTRGPMHTCLNVDEILRRIACELVASGGQATAVALTCCCQSFEGPVLDALWETQDGLTPLLNFLPGDVWNEDKHTVSAPNGICFLLPHLFHSVVF